jgi:hypothetical protein
VSSAAHGHQVGGWYIGLNIVGRCQNVSASRCKGAEVAAHFGFDLLGRAKWQHLLDVYATVKGQYSAIQDLVLVVQEMGWALA